ncbi:hypothetical protein WH47_00964 [Habropoda laboriosa]|uniref:Uncharacterized protein n=1 Tax=Habropoda laboriosa TaxID=597456 RepID=A0A0L7QJY6_9HYME|nr:hypothetical protein WH47_00964 [Habropoda laboriosa]
MPRERPLDAQSNATRHTVSTYRAIRPLHCETPKVQTRRLAASADHLLRELFPGAPASASTKETNVSERTWVTIAEEIEEQFKFRQTREVAERCTGTGDMRSNPAAISGECSGVKRKIKRRSRRGGKKVQDRRRKAIAQELETVTAQKLATVPAPIPGNERTTPIPDIINLCDSSDEETVILPRPPTPIEIVDTQTALNVFNHERIPDDILVSYLRNFSNGTPDEVPQDIAWWCNFVYETQ